MHTLETLPAIRKIDTDRPDLFAVDIVGHLRAADVENLFGLLEAAYALHPRIDVLVRIIDHDGVDWADISSETIETGEEHARQNVSRCAVIGLHGIPDAVAFLAPSPEVELRHFGTDEEAQAWEWLDAGRTD